MPNFGFHIRHGNHSSDYNVDLPDARAAHKEATMIFGDMARGVASQLNETPEWRMDVSDESGKSLFRLRMLTEALAWIKMKNTAVRLPKLRSRRAPRSLIRIANPGCGSLRDEAETVDEYRLGVFELWENLSISEK
jgi:hypothetical protein